jgi:ribosomal protein L24E
MDEWTGVTKLIVDFCNAYVPPKKGKVLVRNGRKVNYFSLQPVLNAKHY